ncbi:geranylgeranyl reductase [Chloropicon primus]|uniref:Geranylgeranyl diphosphate reductase, chloroplastic n=1 Tax=Chloropicon primus TaxID=1764295 RepID=A0A5B8MTF3_9CHLO|nr:geranylgeranyl reductase [Chloropicon primus]UPR02820.1 geranylgeranyl reductase [Chloropicon primus]|eukprot:QDZ23607.1 geranylgeranyl reductase [Chloropicon primus]
MQCGTRATSVKVGSASATKKVAGSRKAVVMCPGLYQGNHQRVSVSSRGGVLSSWASGGRREVGVRAVIQDGAKLDRPLRVAIIGGGPAGACAAEECAKNGCETYMIERKMDNCKPCGGAIPLCMIDEFDLPPEIIDRQVNRMKMISPSNREVDIGSTLKPNEYIGMTRREVLDDYLRQRAEKYGTNVINGLFMGMEQKEGEKGPWTLSINNYGEGATSKGDKAREKMELEVDVVVGADGATSRVAKIIDAGDYDYAIAYQERIRIDQERMKFYENLAEMYVGDDVSPDFYGWVFPKYDHVGVGTGTVINKPAIKQYQDAIRDRAGDKITGGKIIKIEAHPIPEHPRPKRIEGRVALVGDAAGYVTKCSGEGIYFAAKSGRMCGEAIAQRSNQGQRMIGERDLRVYLNKWDRKYWPTYKVLDILQKVFYRSNAAREAFVEMCQSEYVQRMTFDSYLYKTVVPGNPINDIKLLFGTIASILRANALRVTNGPSVTFGERKEA